MNHDKTEIAMWIIIMIIATIGVMGLTYLFGIYLTAGAITLRMIGG